jgi:malonyl-CoA O-methyltransferase
MLSVARDKVDPSSRVRFLEADAETDDLGEHGPFDLIVSTGLLHWLSDPEAAMRKWTGWLAPEGWLICSAFGIDTVIELREVVKQVEADQGIHRPEPALYRSTGEWEEVVRRCGLTKTGSRECWHLLEFPDCRSILATIRSMGESGFVRPLPFGLDRIVVTEVMRRYNVRYRRRRQVYATCHLLQVYGRKPGREVTAPYV